MRRNRQWRAGWAIVAASAWFGVFGQVVMAMQAAAAKGDSMLGAAATILSYWTLQSNLFVALACTMSLLVPLSRGGRFFASPVVRTCISIYIATTGLIYFLLLRGMWHPQGFQLLLDVLLHYVTPVLFLLGCLFLDPVQPLRWRDLPAILIYPLVYLAYNIIRGAIAGAYFYPFIDVGKLGMARVLINSAVLAAFFVAAGAVIVAVNHRVHRRPRDALV